MKLPILSLATAALSALVALAPTATAQECKPPRILLVVDASSSMNNDLGGVTKWQSARNAIETVLTTYPDDAQYGLMLFPGPGAQCSHGEVTVEVASSTGGQILQAMNTPPPNLGAHTPAGQSLMAASQHAAITDPNFDNYVIFVTDGYQYCSVNGGSGCATAADCTFMGVSSCPQCLPDQQDGCYCTRNWPVIGTQALTDAGVTTYVVGFGDKVDHAILNQAADVGGTATPGCDPTATTASCYLQAAAPTELTSVLGQIMQQLVVTETCVGDCGLMGERNCTLDGWADCDAPESQSCVATCGKPGIQHCVNDMLSECSSEGECGGAGGATSAAGGAGATSSGGNSGQNDDDDGGQDPEETGSCACRAAGGEPGGFGGAAGALSVLGLVLALGRRQQRRRQRRRRR